MIKEMENSMTLERRIHQQLTDELISTNEIILAAIAWKNFICKGKGYLSLYRNLRPCHVIVKTGEYHRNPNDESVIYVAKDTEEYNDERKEYKESKYAERKYDDMFSEYDDFNLGVDFYDLVDNYEPEEDFVVLISVPKYVGGSIEYYEMVTPEIPPGKAFHIVKENPSDFGIIDFLKINDH